MNGRTLALLAIAAGAGLANAAAPIDEVLKPCVGCHGMDGVGSTPKTPFLNWQLPKYLVDQMLAYQSGERFTAVPKHIPKTMGKDEIVAIGDHYGKNRTPRTPQAVDAAKLAKGESLHLDKCATCHEDNGRATDDKGGGSPILAGQPAEYLLAQGKLYLGGKRKYSSQQFKDAQAGLGEADLEALAHFFASQDVVPPPDTGKKRKRRG